MAKSGDWTEAKERRRIQTRWQVRLGVKRDHLLLVISRPEDDNDSDSDSDSDITDDDINGNSDNNNILVVCHSHTAPTPFITPTCLALLPHV